MADLSVSGEGLEHLRDSLAQASREIGEDLATLDEKVSNLRSEWSGEASDAYDRAQRQWTANLQELNRILREYSDRIVDIDARYREASRTIEGKIWR
ncbi:WXG100 family type VII secretion target [Microbacterium sp. 18062]|uniref:WXG100 family type VII secretion target n=1 Tax=Microbacterium sp. 18062 TaxID=2681410 RepID=UPI001358391D|nr:WXG100 family type VII secretion target [Microbacterium sp. 18062]